MISQLYAPVAVECEDTGECEIIKLATYVRTYLSHLSTSHCQAHTQLV